MSKTGSCTTKLQNERNADDPKMIRLSLHYENALQEYWSRIPLYQEFFL